MDIKNFRISSTSDGLSLACTMMRNTETPKAAIIFSHGMAEHKERYYDFMRFLCEHDFVVMIHDHRGHGESVKTQTDLGYFYDSTSDFIVEDLHDVYEYIHGQYGTIPVYLFAHSMGTLVARKYLKKYDDTIAKLVLSGAPCNNALISLAIVVTKVIQCFKGGHFRSNLINKLVFGANDQKFDSNLKNSWLSANKENVEVYNADPLCGYIFTCNGFLNLFKLVKATYSQEGWAMHNPELPILFVAGADDPIIGSLNQWQAAQDDLKHHGYCNVEGISYKCLRHEILNEKEKETIYQDVLSFYQK